MFIDFRHVSSYQLGRICPLNQGSSCIDFVLEISDPYGIDSLMVMKGNCANPEFPLGAQARLAHQ